MKLFTTHEFRYLQYKDDFYDPKNYTNGLYEDVFAVFDKIVLMARCVSVEEIPACQKIDNTKIEFLPIYDFNGIRNPFGIIKAFFQSRKAINVADRYWLRSPGFVSFMSAFWLRKKNIIYFLDIPGDPADVAGAKLIGWPKIFKDPLVNLVKRRFQRFSYTSKGALTVTLQTLKNIYPSQIMANDAGVSDVKLSGEVFNFPSRDFDAKIFKIIIIGALLKYKGHAYLLEALSKIKNKRNWSLLCIGQGPEKKYLEQQAKALGVSDRVAFCGRIDWGPKLFTELDKAHLFILSSLTEGMPRVVLEAMARALPVVATSVGGVPEIIEYKYLVPPNNSEELASAISSVWNDSEKLGEMSKRNFEKAKEFKLSTTSKLRRTWFQWLRDYGDHPDKYHFKDYATANLSSEYLKLLNFKAN